MNRLTRRTIMANGMMKKGSKNILEVKKRQFIVTESLAKRVQMREWALSAMMFIFTISYLFYMEQHYDTPFTGIDDTFIDALAITFVFMFAVVIGAVLISILFIPKDFDKYIEKEIF